jgi:O-antigen ligase
VSAARAVAPALALYFVAVQFYASLAALSPTPPVGYAFLGRTGAALLAAGLALAALTCAAALARDGALPALVRQRALTDASASRDLLAAWIGAALLSSLLGLDPLSGIQVVASMLLGACFHVALVRFYRRPRVAGTLVAAYLWTGLIASLLGIAMVLTHVPAELYATANGRAAGFFLNANQFAEFLDLFVLLALGIALGDRPAKQRLLALSGALAGGVALLLTFSRESLAGAAAGAVFLAFVLGRRRTAGALAAIALAAGLGLTLRPFPHHDPSDSFSRLRTLESGLRAGSLFPLTGVGPVAYWRVYPAIRPVNGAAPGTFAALHPHDVYLSAAAELGLVGLAAAAFGWVRFTSVLRRRWSGTTQPDRALAAGVCAGFVALAVSGVFDTIAIVQMTFIWIPYSALALAAVRSAEPGEVPQPVNAAI